MERLSNIDSTENKNALITSSSRAAEAIRQHLAMLSLQLRTLHIDSGAERSLYQRKYWTSRQELDVLVELRAMEDDVIGYADAIASNTLRGVDREIVLHLRNGERVPKGFPLLNPQVIDWLNESGNEFPIICRMLETLDYVKYLCVNYVLHSIHDGHDRVEIT